MRMVPFPLDESVNQALDALELRVQETGAEVVRGDLPRVLGDSRLLAQLFQNLIGNALKFCNADSPRVELSAKNVEGMWEVSVSDNGIGIKPDYAEQIFSPFKRLHGRNEYEGTGIGLSICRKLVERHGGEIWVESELGNGATFKFTLETPEGAGTQDE